MAAWYQRTLTMPDSWTGRHVVVGVEHLNSHATVFVDGKRVGEVHFPGGELDLTAACRPGGTHTLALCVVALPLKAVMLAYTDTAAAREVKGTLARRGLCGDVYLVSTPRGPRIADVKLDTAVRKRECTFNMALDGLTADTSYSLRARITEEGRKVREFISQPFRGTDRKTFTEEWAPDRLWDIHTPQNIHRLEVSLLDNTGRVLDITWPTRFGFREFWIEGRDFYLNGTRIFLSAVPLDNAQGAAALANYSAARESLERLKSIGINYVYTHNYGCQPGSHLGFAEILRAADDVGMLVGLSQPHFSHYDWPAPEADKTNGYARHAAYYVRVAGNHPSVVMYPMNHNATGYSEDMNPDLIDGLHDPRDARAQKNALLALRAKAIVKQLDPARIVYHHASGNLGAMHLSNFYPNFVPIQEMSDWFEHWATVGVKPVFTCEFGAPFTWDWTMYRGWYQGQREFGSARVPWELCLAEWNAQFLGDRAYQISEAEKANLRWEAKQFHAGKVWQRWDYPFAVGSTEFEECSPVFAMYLTDNWRASRTWGVSAISPWQHGHFWKLRDGLNRNARQPLPVDWANLQRPGFSPDYLEQRYERMDLAYDRADWIETPAAQALLRNNRPLLAWLAGKPARFSSHDHNFYPGEPLEKQLIVINNSRVTVTADCQWSLQADSGNQRVTVPTGQQERIPLRFETPAAPGQYELRAEVRFSNGEVQTDSFLVDVLPRRPGTSIGAKIAIFDPKGETSALLKQGQRVEAGADLSGCDILIVGKAALTMDGPALDISRVRDGLKVIVFEQTAEVLEQRFGFRVAEYGLRQVFPRVPDHPLLAGLTAATLRDWRGEATILPPRLKYELSRKFNNVPTVQWCGLPVTRLWRCGNRGNVASVLIEKPARGDFLPIADGGFGLQYAPLLEYREGRGMVLFCQLDVTGRTEREPAAETLLGNVLGYVSAWKPMPRQRAAYTGDPRGKVYFESVGIPVADGEVRIVERDGGLILIGPRTNELPVKVTLKTAEHIAAFFEPAGVNSLLAGIGPADVQNHDPRNVPLVAAGARVVGNGVLACADQQQTVFCQLEPWQFAGSEQPNLRRTHRRVAFLVTRLLANLGVASETPLLGRFQRPVAAGHPEQRWREGFYVDQPEEWDDPYRFFRW